MRLLQLRQRWRPRPLGRLRAGSRGKAGRRKRCAGAGAAAADWVARPRRGQQLVHISHRAGQHLEREDEAGDGVPGPHVTQVRRESVNARRGMPRGGGWRCGRRRGCERRGRRRGGVQRCMAGRRRDWRPAAAPACRGRRRHGGRCCRGPCGPSPCRTGCLGGRPDALGAATAAASWGSQVDERHALARGRLAAEGRDQVRPQTQCIARGQRISERATAVQAVAAAAATAAATGPAPTAHTGDCSGSGSGSGS
mmetsp:Transcript_26640/g.85760  ORF Transcript_26640/g.85760 Transcript_26640/m.85760 type:complete len:253 (-) Transcript_26640:486-1244(-)